MTTSPRLFAAALAVSLASAPLAAQIHVAPTGSDLGAGTAFDPFQTINHAAVVAAPGDTIFLQAGVYGDEQGVVTLGTKDLVLQGAGTGATILHLHSTLTVSLVPPVPGAVASVPHRVGILIAGTATVHLRDLTIDAEHIVPASGQLAGLYLRGGADVVADRVAVLGARPPVLGIGRGHAIALRGDVPVDPTTLAIRRSTCADFGDAGLRALLRAELDAREVDVVGAGSPGAGAFAQHGVLVEADAVASVRSCRIVDCAGAAGAGIRFDGHSTGCRVDGTSIARAAVGIALRRSPPAIVPGDVRNNRIAAVDTTVRIDGVSGVFVVANSLSPVSRFAAVPWWDDTAGGNAWSGNRYPIAAGTPAVAIPGGSNVDASPLAGVAELREAERVGCGGAPIGVVVADFDGDLRDDFATLDLLPGGAGLTVGLWRPAGYQIASLAFGDPTVRPIALVAGAFDGMPGIDLVALTAPIPPATTGASFWVFANDGAGAMTLIHQRVLSGYVAPSALAAVRLNGDANDDLVVVDLGAPPLTPGRGDAFVNAFQGVNWSASALPATFVEPLTAVAAGDLDGDLLPDVAACEGSPLTGRLHCWRSDGLGNLSVLPGTPLALPPNPRGVAIADADGDGDRDLMAAAWGGAFPVQRGVLRMFAAQGGTWTPLPDLASEAGPSRVAVTDLDPDVFPDQARRDVLVLHAAAQGLGLFGSYTVATGFANGGLSTLADGPVDFAIGDFDGDPYGDAVVAEPGRGGVLLLRGSPAARVATLGTGCPGTSGHEPRLVAAGQPGLATQPNPSFRLEVENGFPNSIAACAIALEPGPVLLPCQYLLGAPLFLLGELLDGSGRAVFPLPLPTLPDSRGLVFCAQAGVFDFAATTSFLPSISLTAALCLRVGD